MTIFEKWWYLLMVRKDPRYAQDDLKVTLPVSQLKKLAKKAHDDGFNCGIKAAPQDKYSDLIKDIFGGSHTRTKSSS